MDIDRIIEIVRTLKEEGEVPTNNASSGAIAGLPPDEPPVGKRKKKKKKKGEPTILARGKFPGARARWKKGIA